MPDDAAELLLLTCVECRLDKPVDQFHREAGRATGRNRRCKACRNAINRAHVARDPAARAESMQRWRRRNPEQYAKAQRRFKVKAYGLTLEEYDALVTAQDGRCAICRDLEDAGWDLSVDHDHATGRVRGLLCRRCNLGIGMLREDVRVLQAAADYLTVRRPGPGPSSVR